MDGVVLPPPNSTSAGHLGEPRMLLAVIVWLKCGTDWKSRFRYSYYPFPHAKIVIEESRIFRVACTACGGKHLKMSMRSQTMGSGRTARSRPRSADVNRLLFVRFLADLLDQRFTIPGTSIRVGLDPILGLVPGIGDALANIAGSAILIIAVQLNVPKIVLIRMGLNVAANALIGAIPILGDIFSIWFRSNAKNADLLERYVGSERRRAGLGDWLFVAGIISAVVLIGFGIILAIVWMIGWLRAAWGRAF